MGLIYMRTSPSGKYYIGRTTGSEEKRWEQHVQEALYYPGKGCWLLNQAINKYGRNNFTVKILEDNINDAQLLKEREQYWIDYYDATNNKKGYNRGNSDGYLAKPVIQYTLTGEIIKRWESAQQILSYYHWNERNLYDCLSGGYSHFHNFLWKYEDDSRSIQDLVNKYNFKHGKLGGGTTIYCRETDTYYPSIRALERSLDVNYGILHRKFLKSNEIEYNKLHYNKVEKEI